MDRREPAKGPSTETAIWTGHRLFRAPCRVTFALVMESPDHAKAQEAVPPTPDSEALLKGNVHSTGTAIRHVLEQDKPNDQEATALMQRGKTVPGTFGTAARTSPPCRQGLLPFPPESD